MEASVEPDFTLDEQICSALNSTSRAVTAAFVVLLGDRVHAIQAEVERGTA